jgi:hypothetical protein
MLRVEEIVITWVRVLTFNYVYGILKFNWAIGQWAGAWVIGLMFS